MPKALRTILVGIAGMGRAHLNTLTQKTDRFNLVAVCDAFPRRPDVRESLKLTRGLRLPFFEDYRDAFRQIEADVAFVCAPHHWHAPMTIAALEHGMHVFVEKPATSSAGDADRMVAAQRKAGKVVTVGFVPTTGGPCLGLKEAIARGELGDIREVVTVTSGYRNDDYYRRAKWVGREKVDGKWCRDGVIYNQASHAVSASLMLASAAARPALAVGKRARAALYRAHPVRTFEMEDLACAVVDLDTPAGTRFFFYPTTCNEGRKGAHWTRVFGTKGAATLGQYHIDLYDGRKRAIKRPADVPDRWDNFYQAITRGIAPYNPLVEGVKVTYTIEAIYKAVRGQVKPIKWAELGDLSELQARAAAQRCLFAEMDSPPPWASG